MGHTTGHLWTAKDDQFLRDHATSMTSEEMGKALGGLSKRAVNMRRGRIGARGRASHIAHPMKWTPEDDACIEANYGVRTVAAIAKRLHRTEQAVKDRAHYGLGLRLSDNGYCYVTLQEATGINRETLRRWSNEGILKVSRPAGLRRGRQSSMVRIAVSDAADMVRKMWRRINPLGLLEDAFVEAWREASELEYPGPDYRMGKLTLAKPVRW